jgi:hypothetical protein
MDWFSSIKISSTTGKIVEPIGQDVLKFVVNDVSGKLTVQCKHTQAITSSIFLLAEMCERMYYELYKFSCDRVRLGSFIHFSKQGNPDITIHSTYTNILPQPSMSNVPLHSGESIGLCRPMYVPTDLID